MDRAPSKASFDKTHDPQGQQGDAAHLRADPSSPSARSAQPERHDPWHARIIHRCISHFWNETSSRPSFGSPQANR